MALSRKVTYQGSREPWGDHRQLQQFVALEAWCASLSCRRIQLYAHLQTSQARCGTQRPSREVLCGNPSSVTPHGSINRNSNVWYCGQTGEPRLTSYSHVNRGPQSRPVVRDSSRIRKLPTRSSRILQRFSKKRGCVHQLLGDASDIDTTKHKRVLR
jgi:hypothetical protein